MSKKKTLFQISGDSSGAIKAIQQVESKFAGLRNHAQKLGGGLEGVGGGLRKIGDDMTAAVGRAAGKVADIAKRIGKIGLGIGAAAGAALTKGVIDAMDDREMVNHFAASMGISDAEAKKLGAAVGSQYGKGFGDSLEELADVADKIGTSFGKGLSAAEMEPLIGQAAALAKVMDLDVSESVSAVEALIRNGLVKDGQAGLDLLASSMQGVSQLVRDEIVAATNEYGKHFRDLGMSGEEALSLLASADGVIGVDKIGDALKELTIRATDMSTTSVEAYEAMGLSAQAMSNKMLAGGADARSAMDEIVNGLLGIKDPSAQANAAIALFGTPLEDLGVGQIPAFLEGLRDMDEGLGDVSGSAQAMADKLNSGPKATLERWKRQVLLGIADFAAKHVLPRMEKFFGWIGKEGPKLMDKARPYLEKFRTSVLVPIGTWITNTAIPALQQFGQWIGTNLPGWFAAAKPHIETVRNVLISIGEKIPGIVEAIKGFVEQIVGFIKENPGPVFAALATVIGVALVGALWSMAAAMVAAFSPVYLVVGVIALLAAGLTWAYQNVDWFRDAVDAVARFLVDKLWPAFQKIVSFITDKVVPILVKIITTMWDVYTSIGEAIAGIVKWFTELPGKISSAITGLWDGLKSGITDAKDWVSEKVDDIVGFFSGIGDRISGFFSGVADIISAPFQAGADAIKSAWNSTIGGKGVSIPDIPGLPGRGKRFEIPRLHTGGIFRAETPGGEGFAILRDRERVVTPGHDAAISTPYRPTVVAPTVVVQMTVEGSVHDEDSVVKTVIDGIRTAQRMSSRPLLPGVS